MEQARRGLLLVDDNKELRTALRVLLEEESIVVLGEAGDGEEAVAAAQRLRPDVVLMDVRMDRMDGPAAARLIHRELPLTRVIFFTATTPVETCWFQHTGAVAVLGKGIPPDLLITAIRSAADGSQLSDPS